MIQSTTQLWDNGHVYNEGLSTLVRMDRWSQLCTDCVDILINQAILILGTGQIIM